MIDAALAWAKRGVPVFPLRPKDKIPLTTHGVKDASTDPEVVRSWWSKWPDANIGGATGAPSGRWVLDLDGEAGVTAWASLEAEYGAAPESLTVATARGRHLWFALPDDGEVRNSAGKVAVGIDVRGTGGYVVLPPSIHPTGVPYRLENDLDAARAPAWLLARVMGSAAPVDAGLLLSGPRPASSPDIDHRRVRGVAEAAARAIVEAPEGQRNETVNTLCFNVGGYAAFHGVPLEDLSPILEPAAVQAEQPASMVLRALKDGTSRPRSLPPREQDWLEASLSAPAVGGGAPPPQPVDIDKLCNLDRSDLGNAKRLDARFGRDMRWSQAKQEWLVWSATHWEWDERRTVHRWSQQTVELLKDETIHLAAKLKAMGPPGDDEPEETAERRKALEAMVKSSRGHALGSQASGRISAIATEARGLRGKSIAMVDLDRDRMLLNTLSGTIDLETGKCRPHDRFDHITRIAPVKFNPAATCPEWLKFTKGIFPKPEVRALVKRAMGLSLTGDISLQVWFLMKGEGSNGKSTLIDIMRAMIGGYAFAVAAGVLEQQIHERHETELVGFKGSRFASATEPRKGKKWDAEKLKRLTGNDPISARGMRENMFEFDPTHKLWVACNDVPATDDSTYGFWRRLVVIPFDVQFRRPDEPDDGRPMADLGLPARLKAEISGILNWALEGLAELRKNGLQVPDACKVAAKAYREEQDHVGQFVNEECERGRGVGHTPHRDLYRAFQRWWDASGLPGRPMVSSEFGKHLNRLGVNAYEGHRKQSMRCDIRLLSAPVQSSMGLGHPSDPGQA